MSAWLSKGSVKKESDNLTSIKAESQVSSELTTPQDLKMADEKKVKQKSTFDKWVKKETGSKSENGK